MPDNFSFTLPVSATHVKLCFRVNTSLRKKEYLATFSFISSGAEIDSTATTPKGLQYSNALGLPFSYIPGIEVAEEGEKEVLELPEFAAPFGTREIEVTIRPWDVKTSDRVSPFAEAVLEIHLLDRPTLVFPKEK